MEKAHGEAVRSYRPSFSLSFAASCKAERYYIIMKTLDLSTKLFEHYDSTQRVYHYFGLLSLFALSQTAIEADDSDLLKKCKDMLALYPDKFDHPRYNFENYRVGGAGKAWLVYKGLWDEEKENIRKYAEKTLLAPASREGILCWPTDPDKNKIWIDIVYAVAPFMLYAGLALSEDKYIDFAVSQCFKMYEFFLDKTCGLLHQSRGFMPDKTRVSFDHWSRGNGWGYLGLTELIASLPKDSKHRPKAEEYFCELSRSLLAYQTEKGVWRQELTCDYSWNEASGTGLILYGIGVGLRLGLLDTDIYKEPYKKGIAAMAENFITPEFSTLMSCIGCLCPGEGDEKGTIKSYLTAVYHKTDEPHSFGALMLALTEAHRNGITDVSLRS